MIKLKLLLNSIPKYIFVLFFVTCIIFIPARDNLGIYGHDSEFHAINILAMESNTKLFEFPTRIRPIIANDFGYGTGIFYPQLFHFLVFIIYKIIKVLHISNVYLANCINIYLFLFIFVVSICMRKLLYKYTANSKVSTIGSIFYILYPYFIDDIYVRSAYGELIVFLSLPLIFLGLYYLFNENNKFKFYICFVLGFYLLFSSHLISSVYTTLIIFIFLLFNIKNIFKNYNIVHLAIASFFTILISLNYLVPILEHSILGDYLAFQKDFMSSRYRVLCSILPFDNLFLISKNTDWLDAFIPISLIILLMFLLFNYKKYINRIEKNIINGHLFIIIVASILVIFPIIWLLLPMVFINIQFAWRNCAYIGFSVCVLATLGLLVVPKKYFKLISIFSLIISFISFFYIVYYPGHIVTYNNWMSNIKGMGVEKEYLPKNVYDNMDYFDNRNNDVYIVSGTAKINVLEDDTPYLKFKVDTRENLIVEIPRIYYLWYDVNLVDKDNNKFNLEFYENEFGFIEFSIPKSGIVYVDYKKTFISKLSSIISFISIFIFGLYLYLIRKKLVLN